jgi:hypothetical protein
MIDHSNWARTAYSIGARVAGLHSGRVLFICAEAT